MWKDFRAFISRGSILDMVVGFSVGAVFTALVKSLVDNVIMPPVAFLLGYVDFVNRFVVLREGKAPAPYATLDAANEAGALTWRYGLFLNSAISFVLVSLAVFMTVKAVGRMSAIRKEEKPAAEPATKACPHCCLDIPLQARRCPHCTSMLE